MRQQPSDKHWTDRWGSVLLWRYTHILYADTSSKKSSNEQTEEICVDGDICYWDIVSMHLEELHASDCPLLCAYILLLQSAYN